MSCIFGFVNRLSTTYYPPKIDFQNRWCRFSDWSRISSLFHIAKLFPITHLYKPIPWKVNLACVEGNQARCSGSESAVNIAIYIVVAAHIGKVKPYDGSGVKVKKYVPAKMLLKTKWPVLSVKVVAIKLPLGSNNCTCTLGTPGSLV